MYWYCVFIGYTPVLVSSWVFYKRPELIFNPWGLALAGTTAALFICQTCLVVGGWPNRRL